MCGIDHQQRETSLFPLFSIKYFLGQFFSLLLNIRSTLKTVNSNFQFLLIIRRNLLETHRIETSKRNMVFVKQVNILCFTN